MTPANIGCMPTPKLMGYPEVADRLGVSLRVARKYLTESRAHRKEGKPRPGDMPEPDLTIGQSPAWEPKTIEAWIARRPGQGFRADRVKPTGRKKATK